MDAGFRTKMSSIESEERFRQIFFAHLESEGYSEDDSNRLIFKTPDPFHHVPSIARGLELMADFKESYQRQLPHAWFFEGLDRKSEYDKRFLQAPQRPVTFVVIPGIFAEFIEQVPFQSVVDRRSSHFSRQWREALEMVPDSVYKLLELEEVPCRLTDVVEIVDAPG